MDNRFLEDKFQPGKKIRVLVGDKWILSEIISSHDSPDPNENFLRINIKTEAGLIYHMCHPECIELI